MILIAFYISHTQNIKGHSGSEKTYSNFVTKLLFPKSAPIWIKVLCNDCIVCQLNKPYPNQKQIAQKQDFKGQSLYFNHRISFDTKGPISPNILSSLILTICKCIKKAIITFALATILLILFLEEYYNKH